MFMIVESRMIIILGACNLFFLKTHVFFMSVLGATPNHVPLKYRCLVEISNRPRHVYLVLKLEFGSTFNEHLTLDTLPTLKPKGSM